MAETEQRIKVRNQTAMKSSTVGAAGDGVAGDGVACWIVGAR